MNIAKLCINKTKDYFKDFHKMAERVFDDKKTSILFSFLIHSLLSAWFVLSMTGYMSASFIPMLLIIVIYGPVLWKLDKINEAETLQKCRKAKEKNKEV